MTAKRNRAWLATLALGFVVSTPADAWAYVDPGTGSYLFQLAAAGFLAGMFTLRRYWDVVKSRFGRQAMSARVERSTDQSE
jgi:hypothetical protein